MKYYIYASDNLFKEKDIIAKVKKLIISNDLGIDLDIKYKLTDDQKLCYAFIQKKNESNNRFILKALLYV